MADANLTRLFPPVQKSVLIQPHEKRVVEDYPLSEYLTEQEQVELLKQWIKQYAPAILAGFVIALTAAFGWQLWQRHENKLLSHASANFDEMIAMRSQNNLTAESAQSDKLLTHYKRTVYGKMASLMDARSDVQTGKLEEATKNLTAIIDHPPSKAIQQIARIRLARVLLSLNKPKESLSTLEKIDDPTFSGLTNEVRGDAYLALNETAKAKDAYANALRSLPNAQTLRPLLQMKYDQLTTKTASN